MKDKLRIAMFGHKRIPSREGGVEVVVETLAAGMAAKGHSVVCYNRKGHHVAGSEFDREKTREYRGVKIKEVFTIQAKGMAAMSSSFLAAFLTAFGRYDVVHIHAEGSAFLCRLPKLFGKRVVVTIHGLDHKRAKWGALASRYILAGEKNAVRYADKIIVLSLQMKQYFTRTYGRDTVYIPNGVRKPEKLPARQITERFGLKKDDYLLFLGRLVPEKGVHYLIEAYKTLHTNKKLVIAGGQSDSADYTQRLYALAAGHDNILFTGFVSGTLLGELYRNAFLYVLPSDLEGMPLSLLEAMSYGNCCVTSDIAECTEVVENKAVIFKKSDINDLREKLQFLCNEPSTIGRYRLEASEFICGKYNWDDVIERTLEEYR